MEILSIVVPLTLVWRWEWQVNLPCARQCSVELWPAPSLLLSHFQCPVDTSTTKKEKSTKFHDQIKNSYELHWFLCILPTAIRSHSPAKPVLIFVSSRRQTRLTALELIAFLATEEDPKQWLNMDEQEVSEMLFQVLTVL
jgi:hypothetical protein